jgi:hypothetical protein
VGVTNRHVPFWIRVVLFAERLNIPAWEVAEGGDRKLWYERHEFVMRERNRAKE